MLSNFFLLLATAITVRNLTVLIWKWHFRKLSLSASGVGLCPFATERGCVGRRQLCNSTPCNCAALVTTCAQPGSLKGQAAAHQLSSGILPLAFKSCVFQTAQESGACCPVKGRSSSRGQPALLRLPAFPPSLQCIRSSCFSTGKVKESNQQPGLDYSITTVFPFVHTPMKSP